MPTGQQQLREDQKGNFWSVSVRWRQITRPTPTTPGNNKFLEPSFHCR